MQGSEHAKHVDALFMAIFWLNVVFFVLIAFLTVYSVYVFRRKAGVRTPHLTHNLTLEVVWTVIPTFIVIGIFFWGAAGYMESAVAPADAMEISVTAQKWSWAFEYPDGSKWVKEMRVPEGRSIKLVMTSVDVLHDFYIPDMRVKHDVIPNRYTEVWFKPEAKGTYHVACAEYCGKSHSDMSATIKVVSEADYQKWLQEGPDEWKTMEPEKLGKMVYEQKGCNNCHSVDGSKNQGPTWKGIYGHKGKFTDGTAYEADEAYITESINYPAKHIVEGYSNVMPSFEGLIRPIEMKGLIAYMKSLK
jgi:cytochrome c oxidase subunit 2